MAARGDSKKRSEPEAGTPDWADRRRSVRFAVMLRVDYPSGGRTRFAYTSNLSTTGVYLRGDFGFEVGKRLALALNLKTEELPVRISAVVRNMRGGAAPGAGLEFLPGQEGPVEAVRRFLEAEHVAKLEASLARSLSNGKNVALLAGYYAELGRAEEAIDLYRRAVDANPAALELREGLARLLVARVRLGEEGARPAFEELEALLAGGEGQGGATLDRLAVEAVALRAALEQGEQERARREEEERGRREREQEERLRAEIGRGVREAADRELAARRRELELELAAKGAAFAKEREELEAALARERERAEAARLREAIGRGEAPPDPRLRELGERVESLEQAASAREAEASELRARLEAREKEVATLTEELRRRRGALGEVAVLQAALDEATDEAGRLRVEAREGVAERERLQGALAAAEGALEAERARLRSGDGELRAALDAERGRLQERAEALEQARALAEAEAGRLEERGRELALAERALAEGRQSIDAQRTRLDERERSLSAAEGALTEERRRVLTERGRVEKGARELAIAKRGLEDDRGALARERTELEARAQALAEAEGRVTEERAALWNRVRALDERTAALAEREIALARRGAGGEAPAEGARGEPEEDFAVVREADFEDADAGTGPAAPGSKSR